MTGPPGPALPLVVQVGFAGSRRSFGDDDGPPEAQAELRRQLRTVLESLPTALGLSGQHFIAGISQLAAGADMLFTEVMAELGWPQRLFLPQLRTHFLAAEGSSGPDCQPDQRAHAAQLFNSPHIIEETVVSTAADRAMRFEDANLRILGESDVVLYVRHEGVRAPPDGTGHLFQLAQARGIPVLELVLRCSADAGIVLEPHWHRKEAFVATALPPALAPLVSELCLDDGLPASELYAQRIKESGARHAGDRRRGFQLAAVIIVGSHVIATLLAVLAMMKVSADWRSAILVVLVLELLLLATGFVVHWRLHHGQAGLQWAVTRLCAEIGRSVRAFDGLPLALNHLLALPFPQEFKPMLRTMNVLHLRSCRVRAEGDWTALRDRYLQSRLLSMKSGQVPYYLSQSSRARRWLNASTACFTILSGLAFVATLVKVLITGLGGDGDVAKLFGVLAVWLPVLAVGAMSLAAAYDAEARAHTFDDLHRFVQAQAAQVATASSMRELATLASETEVRLLGESLTWYARRAYASVA